jgi:phosphoglycolate phosphatase
MPLVVFDLDGTLVDSSRDLADAGNATLATYDRPPLPEAEVVAMVGDGARELVRRLLTAASLDVSLDEALERFLRCYDERLLATTRPYDGVISTLEALKETTRFAVLTNKPEAASRRLLEGLELAHYFCDVIGGDSPYGRKPDPRGLFALLGRYDVPTEEALMVGDSMNDLLVAEAAAVPMCFARYGFGYQQVLEPDRMRAAHTIDAPEELLELFASGDRQG